MFLTTAEIQALTCKETHPAQVRVLRAMGIEHKVRPDGSIVVLRAHVEHLLGGPKPAKPEKDSQPDWSPLAKAS